MRTAFLFMACLGMTILPTPRPAQAHPAEFEHRHVGRRATLHAPLSRIRRPLAPPRQLSRASLTLGLSGAVVADGDDPSLGTELDGGLGMDLNLGVRLSPYASIHVAWLTAVHDSMPEVDTFERAVLTSFSFDIRAYLLPNAEAIEPFVQVGTGLTEMRRDGGPHRDLSGISFLVGGGVHVPLNPSIALTAFVLYRPALLEALQPEEGQSESELLHLFTGSMGMSLRL